MSFFTRRRSSRTSCWSSDARQVRHVQAHHDLRCRAEPPTGRRARDPEIRGDGHVPGALDEIPKPVVVALLRAGRGRHGTDHRPFPHAAQLLEDECGSVRRRDDNSRGKVQNVRGDSSARCHASLDGHAPLTFAGGRTVAPVDLSHVRWVSHCRNLVQLPVAA